MWVIGSFDSIVSLLSWLIVLGDRIAPALPALPRALWAKRSPVQCTWVQELQTNLAAFAVGVSDRYGKSRINTPSPGSIRASRDF
jgi:hypothetical protein